MATPSSKSRDRDGSPLLLPHHASWIYVVDMWAQPPLTVSGVLHDLDGEEVKAPSMPHTIQMLVLNGRFGFPLRYK
jgi:hypothetical protein